MKLKGGLETTVFDVEICNFALDQLNAHFIRSFGDDTKEARLCKRYYETVRNILFSRSDWTFAQRTSKLDILGEDPDKKWKYMYKYYINYEKIITVFPESKHVTADKSYLDKGKIRNNFTIETRLLPPPLSTNAIIPVILTDIKNPVALLIDRNTPMENASSDIVESLVWVMVYYLAMPLLGIKAGSSIHQLAKQNYEYYVNTALVRDSSERYETKETESSFFNCR